MKFALNACYCVEFYFLSNPIRIFWGAWSYAISFKVNIIHGYYSTSYIVIVGQIGTLNMYCIPLKQSILQFQRNFIYHY